ncbi:MAG: MFS transporter, partial [Pyrinomonadaceae bacterium]
PVLAGLVLASTTNGYDLHSSRPVLSGPAIVYAANAASFIAVIVALLMMEAGKRSRKVSNKLLKKVEDQVADEEERQGLRGAFSFASLKEGVEFVWRTPIIVQTMALDFTATFFASATALLPIFAAEVLHVGAKGLGWLAAAPAIGASAAGIFMARRGNLSKPGAAIIGSIFVYGAATIVFGASRVFWLSLLMLAVTGAADTVSTVLRQTIRQLVTPDRLRGRMTSVNMIFFMGGPQLGELEAGLVAQFAGAPFSVITGGIGCMIGIIIALMSARSLLRYRFQK